jgi:hypothetical protein
MNNNTSVTSTPASTATVKVATTIPTPPLQMRYVLKTRVMVPSAYVRSVQRTIVWNVLLTNFKKRPDGMTIDEIAAIAESAGLKAVGGVGPSVRYHLHYMKKDGWVEVKNPTTRIQVMELPDEPEETTPEPTEESTEEPTEENTTPSGE